jgi:hypothetical protein
VMSTGGFAQIVVQEYASRKPVSAQNARCGRAPAYANYAGRQKLAP